jgi:antitoxin (DNA-binding transcriptional repressor) of toxin-antitoxin stability system
MQYLQFTDFRNNSKLYFDLIEKGSSFIIIRKGKPIAQISPFSKMKIKGWQRKIQKVSPKGDKTTLEYIEAERNEK